MRVSMVGVVLTSFSLAFPCMAQLPGAKNPAPVPPLTSAMIRDCPSISAGDRNLAPLSAVCEFVKTMHRILPNFLCQQVTQRYTPISRQSEERRPDDVIGDTVSATVIYEEGVNHYTDIKIGDKVVQGEMSEIPGVIALGEFGSELFSIFLTESAAAFDFQGQRRSLTADDYNLFSFRISAASNHFWTLREGSLSTNPDLRGMLWTSKTNNKVLRLDISAEISDSALSTHHVSVSTTFGDFQFGDTGEFVLPRQSEAKRCTRNSICMHNVTEWANCKRFAAKARIIPDPK